jgi:2'-5' RNA ligase
MSKIVRSPEARFFIALLLPTSVQDAVTAIIEQLSDRYRTRTARVVPHITLQPPFLWELDQCNYLHRSLREFAPFQSPVPITLSGFGAFAPRVLYIHVEKTPALMQLQSALMQHLEDTLAIEDVKSEKRGFTPHVTVASRKLTRQTFKDARADLQGMPFEEQFICDRLTLLIYENNRWHTDSDYLLSADS